MIWAGVLILGYALVYWGSHSQIISAGQPVTFWTYLYLSGVTFFTLGYGDVSPVLPFGRFVSVVEAANGLGLLAVVISYLPVLYQSFSKRETSISLLDARAGSPSSAVELLRRHRTNETSATQSAVGEWEDGQPVTRKSSLISGAVIFVRSMTTNHGYERR
jgi:hypothetical protein